MPETIHMYITIFIAFLLTVLGGATGWLALTVISNQSRIAVLETAIINVSQQIGEIKQQLEKRFDAVDREMGDGFDKLHKRISAVQGRA